MKKKTMRSKKNARKTKRIRGGMKAEEEPNQAAGNLTKFQKNQINRLGELHQEVGERSAAYKRRRDGEPDPNNKALISSERGTSMNYVVTGNRPLGYRISKRAKG